MIGWTEERIAEAARLWSEDKSLSEIAAALDVGKGAIAGLSFRHRDKFPSREQGKTLGNEKRRKPMELLEPAEYDAKRIKRGKTLLDLNNCDCRWMVSDTLFCAAEQKPGKSYCEHHYKRSRGPGTISERKAVPTMLYMVRREA